MTLCHNALSIYNVHLANQRVEADTIYNPADYTGDTWLTLVDSNRYFVTFLSFTFTQFVTLYNKNVDFCSIMAFKKITLKS